MKDYWSFQAVLRTFRAVGYGKFKVENGLEWRTRGRDFVLVSPPQSSFKIPAEANPERVRSLSYLEGTIGEGVPTIGGSQTWTYECSKGWEPNRKTRYELRSAQKAGVVTFTPKPEELHHCMDVWVDELTEAKPNMMIVKGHYRKMIEDEGIQFIGCQVNNEILGAVGFTWEGEDGVVCFTKHTRKYRWVGRLLWCQALNFMFGMTGVTSVNCGDTADKLKRELGFTPHRQERVDFSKVEQEVCTISSET